MSAFKGIGVLVFIYTVYCVFKGNVYAKDKASGRTVIRADEPKYYWSIIIIYFGLSIACFFFF
ncbi:MAG: hypothetical protein HND53_05800 [Proteobacteria bacterium]|nr:hypothetical protein [Pseudomonadota bacterium]NOG59996.1 hypothetical protein [Pseudomonadota bacterium]